MTQPKLSTYLNPESGPRGPAIEALDRLANALGTTPSALLDDGTPAPPVVREVEHPIAVCLLNLARAAGIIVKGVPLEQAFEELAAYREPEASDGVPTGSSDEEPRRRAPARKPKAPRG